MLNQPFPFPEKTKLQKIVSSLYEGLGTFIFFLVFQPFGLSNWHNPGKFWHIAGYGLIVFSVTLSYRFLVPLLFPRYFSESTWVVWKEIAGSILILIFITLGILIYLDWSFGKDSNTYQNFGKMFFIVTLIGSIPITIEVLSRYVFLYKKYSQKVEITTSNLDSNLDELVLTAENEKDFYSFEASSLLFIESADNYCSIVLENTPKKLIRSSLTRLENQINHPKIVRCHRSFIVNLNRVKSVSGNAQGYKLHLSDGSLIPVARKNSNLINYFKTE